MNREVDIVVCGAGIVGLMFANLLAQTRYRVLLVDAGSEPVSPQPAKSPDLSGFDLASGFAPRVSALNAGSVALLKRLDLLSGLGRHIQFSEMLVRDGEGSADIRFSAADLGGTGLGLVIENHLLVSALHNRLDQFEQIELQYGAELSDIERENGTVTVSLADGTTITCDLLVGADGGNSRVREMAGLKTLGWDYDQTALVTTIQTSQPHESIPRQWFTGDGPLAFLPLADPHLCSIVWSHRNVGDVLDLESDAFCRRLTAASEEDLGEVVGADKRFSFPLRQQHVYRYTSGGIALIGDAAHTIHPLAGQGANLGIADAEALAMELRQTVFSDQRPGDLPVLRRFALARQPHNLAIATAMETLKRLYGTSNPAIGWLRNQSMRLLNQNDVLRALIMKLAAG